MLEAEAEYVQQLHRRKREERTYYLGDVLCRESRCNLSPAVCIMLCALSDAACQSHHELHRAQSIHRPWLRRKN